MDRQAPGASKRGPSKPNSASQQTLLAWKQTKMTAQQSEPPSSVVGSPAVRFLLPGKNRQINSPSRDACMTLPSSSHQVSAISTSGQTFDDDIEQFSSEEDVDIEPTKPPKRKRPEVSSASPGSVQQQSSRFTVDEGSLILDDGGETGAAEIIPAELNEQLLEYQREGVRFLHRHYKSGKGAILADEMGLGKTVQAIAFITAIKGGKGATEARRDFFGGPPSKHSKTSIAAPLKPNIAPVLVVAPAGLLHQWHLEFRRFCSLRAFVCHSTNRDIMLDKAAKNKLDVLILSYELFKSCFERLNDSKTMRFSCAFFDEAHRIKSMKSKLGKICMRFRVGVRFGLTGTVVQNSLDELFVLLNFVAPHLLGDMDYFKQQFMNPIHKGYSRDATDTELRAGRDASRRLASILGQHMLRRTKSSVASQLPPKEEQVVVCAMTELQRAAYEATLASRPFEMLRHNVTLCTCGSPYIASKCCFKYDQMNGDAWRQSALPALGTLQRLASLVDSPSSSAGPSGTSTGAAPSRSELPHSLVEQSGKLAVLDHWLPNWLRQGDHILLFSNSTQTLDMLELYLNQKRQERDQLFGGYRRIDGSMPVAARQRAVAEFSRQDRSQTTVGNGGETETQVCSIPILLMSTRACALGLNLAAANVVVIFEPNWNVSLDMQASNRAHRLGQQRVTRVYRFVTAESVEEVMYRRQLFKLDCAQLAHSDSVEAVQRRPYSDSQLFGAALLFSTIPTAFPVGAPHSPFHCIPSVAPIVSASASSEPSTILSLIVSHALSTQEDDIVDIPLGANSSVPAASHSRFLDSSEEEAEADPDSILIEADTE